MGLLRTDLSSFLAVIAAVFEWDERFSSSYVSCFDCHFQGELRLIRKKRVMSRFEVCFFYVVLFYIFFSFYFLVVIIFYTFIVFFLNLLVNFFFHFFINIFFITFFKCFSHYFYLVFCFHT